MATEGVEEEDERSRAIVAQRGYLLRYALLHVRDTAHAEDIVQDTVMAALAPGARFEGRAQLRTWLTGILKNKIVDHFRRQERAFPLGLIEALESPDAAAVGDEFTAAGRWAELPGRWEQPEASMETTQFWRVYEECCKRMPARHALVFSMREVMGMTTEEICKDLGISPSNLHVILFRARLRLRECVTRKWFEAHGR